MERSKCLLVLILIVTVYINLNATEKSDIYLAYINGDMGKWKTIIDQMNQQQVKSNEFLLELTNYQYGYIGWSLGNYKRYEAEKYLCCAEENIKILEKANYRSSLVNSYKSAFYGFRIGLNKYKAIFIGHKSVECAKLAMKQDEKNPFGFIQFGNCQYYMPVIFGGSKSKAILHFMKAEQLMILDGKEIKEDWNYLNLLTLIGQSYSKLRNYKQAKVYYDKAIKFEPRFLWVKNELYPELLRNIKD